MWDADTGAEIHHLGRTPNSRSPVWRNSPDGKRIVSGTGNRNGTGTGDTGELTVWDADTFEEIHSLKGHQLRVSSVAYSPDGKRIAVSGEQDKTLNSVWTPTRAFRTLRLPGEHGTGSTCVAFSPGRQADSQRRLGQDPEGVDYADKAADVLSLMGHRLPVTSVAYSPDGKRILSASSGGTGGEVKEWDAVRGREILNLRGFEHGVNQAAYSPDGKHVVCAGYDDNLKVLDADTGAVVLALKTNDLGWS